MERTPLVIGISENLRALAWVAVDDQNAVILDMQARETEEEICFRVTTTAPIKESKWIWPALNGKGPQFFVYAEVFAEYHYAISIDRKFLDDDFLIAIQFDQPGDPRQYISKVDIWDKSDGVPQLVCFEFGEQPNQSFNSDAASTGSSLLPPP